MAEARTSLESPPAGASAAEVELEVLDATLSPARRGVRWILTFLALALGALSMIVLKGNPKLPVALFFFPLQGLVTLAWAWRLTAPVATFRKVKARVSSDTLRFEKKVVHARDVRGSSTAFFPSGVHEMAVAVRGRRRPVLLRVRTAQELAVIHESLGIGQRDANLLSWSAGVNPIVKGVLAAFGFVLQCWSTRLAWSDELTRPFSILFFVGTLLAMINLLGVLLEHPLFDAWLGRHRLTLSSAGVHVRSIHARGADVNSLGAFIPYEEIENVERTGPSIFIERKGNTGPSLTLAIHDRKRLTEVELEHIVAQIRCAVLRARGSYLRTGKLEETLAILEKGSDTATWLGHLDAIEQAQGQGYRGNLLDRDALLRTVNDPDMAPAVRFAAARLLRRDPEARVRVEDAASHARFGPEQKMLRVALSETVENEPIDELLTEVQETVERHRSGQA